jgi:UPF0176 protein
MLHSAFYRFLRVNQPEALANQLRSLALNLTGSIVVAFEGINGTVAGAQQDLAAFEDALQGSGVLGGALRGMVFKRSACTTAPFGRMKVSVKPEIVALGLALQGLEQAALDLPAPDEHDSSHLPPEAWRQLMERQDVVLLDNRNHFEYRLGHFRGAVDPQVHNFRDFADYVLKHAATWREASRPVAMYCTGGIRCDKTAPWLRSLGLEVWQLQGGVLNYFQTLDDAGAEWEGECFVFDNRIALDTTLRETPTTAEAVFDPQHEDEAWRLQRAQRLSGAA